MNAFTDKPKLLVLLGPTAVGKTKLSLEIANMYQCEIISGDSMQVYRGMDVGTAKASAAEQQMIPHHMIDIVEPDDPFSTADFQEKAKELIQEIHERGKLPFIVGGTGLYIESVCYDYQFIENALDAAFRQHQSEFANKFGNEALHEKLKQIDPNSASRLHPNDQRRIIRALEIFHLTGKTLSEQLENQQKQSPYELCIIGLTMDRAKLYQRIEQRVDEMMEQDLIKEVSVLLNKGYTPELVSMQGLGYKEIVKYIQGAYNLKEAITILKRDTRRFAKRQLSWFRHMQDIQWVDVTDVENFSAHLQAINDIIARKFNLG